MDTILLYRKLEALNFSYANNRDIADDGKGFVVQAKRNGIGLRNIKKRAESFSGKFIINSAPGKGCELIVEIPLGL